MDRLIERAKQTTWRAALLEAHSDVDDLWKRFADEGAGQWKVLLPQATRGRALWLDGPGGAAIALARWCKTLVVRCGTSDEAAFLRLQVRQMGMENLHPVAAASLPFPDRAFDLVATADGHTDLAAARRVLRPDGHLFLAASNRWTDPQPGASGYGGWRRRLRKAGFPDCRVYGLLPKELISFAEPARRVGLPFKERPKRMRRLCPRWGFVAHGAAAGEGWLEGFTRHVIRRLGLDTTQRFPRTHSSGATSSGLLLFLGETAIVRVALDPDAEAGVDRNFSGLGAARERGIDAPDPLLLDRFEGVRFSVESRLQGAGIRSRPQAEWRDAEERIFELLMTMHAEASLNGAAVRWRTEVVEPLQRASAWAGTKEERNLAGEIADRAAAMEGAALPLVFTHGDLHHGNVLVSPDGSIRLLDWDSWHAADIASLDFLHFVCRRRCWRDGTGPTTALLDWLDKGPLDEAEAGWTVRYVAHHELVADWQAGAALSYWARELAPRTGTAYDLDRPWIAQNYLAVLPRMRAALTR